MCDDDEDDDGEEEDGFYNHEEINWGHKGKRNEKKKKKKTKKNKEIVPSKLKKAKKIIHKIKIKENRSTSKLRDQDKAIGNPTENENDISNRVTICKKKPRLQHLNGDTKTMACEAFKLSAQNQNLEDPKRGILKEPGKAKCILQEAVHVNHCGKQEVDKHVTFLQKGNALRLRRQQSGPVERLGLENYSGSDMHGVHASGVGKDSAIVETNGTEYVSNGTETEMEPFGQSVTSDIKLDGKNQHFFDIGLRDAPHDPQYTHLPGFACMPREVNYNGQNVNVIMNCSSSTGGRLTKDLGTCGPRVPSKCFKDYLRMHNEPSASNHYETIPHLSPRELLQTVCSPPDGYQTGNIHGKKSIHGINEGFVGLPLNSQGALIRLSSSDKGDLNQMIKSSTTAAPPISLSLPSNSLFGCIGEHSERRSLDWRTSSSDQLNLFPVEGYLNENPIRFVPSRLDITESRDNGQTNLDLDLIKSNDHSNQVQKSHGNENILPTMRLMGKEFIVSRRGFQRFEDGHIWKDKQVTDDLCLNNTSFSSVMMHNLSEPSIGKLKETLLSINHRSGSMYTFPHFDCQTSSMQERNGFVATNPGLSQGKYAAVSNSELLFPEPFPTGYKSQVVKLELPTPHAAHRDSCPNISSIDIQPKNKQNQPHPSRSAIRFPFMHPDLEGHQQSSWSGSSNVNRSPFFADVSKKGTLMSNFQPYHNLGRSSNHNYVIPGTNQLSDSSVSLKPKALPIYNPFSFDSTMQSPVGPAFSHPTLLTQQGIMPISSVQKSHGNQNKLREQIKSSIGIRHLGHSRKAKRRASVVSSVSFQPVMMPSLGIEEGSRCAIAKPPNSVNFDDVQNIEMALESCSSTNKSNILMCDEYTDDMNERRIYPRIDPYGSAARSGAIKLTGGAKHILKACQQIDQSSSRNTDPNTPFAATTAGSRFSESDNPAKIY
ncbi:hypothetical protein CDL12_05950 [Handroanthus impetiginosus]|uniref:Uncharacterized protein n=1 Tax=Handroanthus impetiginosus TaxID=429701 RepID=A0A2G9HV00_9LAMI|nr:hypothetical protein CDL12_05950 [Handroanthus impetiginosus]